MKENEIIEYSAEREEQKENINKNERKTNIELKIDEITRSRNSRKICKEKQN